MTNAQQGEGIRINSFAILLCSKHTPFESLATHDLPAFDLLRNP